MPLMAPSNAILQYTSIDSIDAALANPESAARLVEWLLIGSGSGKSGDSAATEDFKAIDNESKGLKQGSASLLILNAIREACRAYLDDQSGAARTHADVSFSPPAKPARHEEKAAAPTYEEAFPALSSSSSAKVLTARSAVPTTNANKNSSKPKRRIRPATLSTATGGLDARKGNLVNAPSLNEPGVAGTSSMRWPGRKKAQQSPSKPSPMPTTPKVGSTPKKKVWGPAHQVTPVKETVQTATPVKETVHIADPILETPEFREEVALDRHGDSVELDNLVSVYCALIRGCLVPSTAGEVQFLIRLLVATSNPSAAKSAVLPATDSPVNVRSALSCLSRCRSFASKSLSSLALVVLERIGHNGLLVDMIRCPPIQQYCPDFVEQVQAALDRRAREGEDATDSRLHGHTLQMLTSSQVAHWTVPFHEGRDSRHRFRSRDEQTVYKNREETRDAFLYQLRTFLGYKGKVVDRVQHVKNLETMKFAFRDIVGKLSPSNLAWFAERMFRDLLLQIGLVPVEETDSELLKMTDQDKLQKLHQRFTSKHPQQRGRSSSNGNFKNGSVDTNHDLTSPATEARSHFPGHQDFFYMFLLSVDSQRLSVHLTATLAATISELSAQLGPSDDMNKRCMEMCMVARFLGVLVFSPNWQSASISPELQVQSGYNGLGQLSSAGIPIVDTIREAYNQQRLIAVVPWVVDLLKLANRDPISKASSTYREVVCLLRELQLLLLEEGYDACALIVVKLSLETFMGEMVGVARLPAIMKEPLLGERSSVNTNTTALDLTCGSFGLQSLVTVSVHVQDLSDLVSRLLVARTDVSALKSPGAVRKVRPSVLASPGIAATPSPSTERRSPQQLSLSPGPPSGDASAIQSKLVDTFFHQHRDLKDVCEFAAARALPIAFASALADDNWTSPFPPRSEAYLRFRSLVEDKLKECLQLALSALISPTSAGSLPRGRDTAVQLTVAHILRSNEERIKRKVDDHYARFATEPMAGASKQLFSDPCEVTNRGGNKNANEKKEAANARLRELTASLVALTSLVQSGTSNVTAESLVAVLSCLSAIDDAESHQIPTESELRPFFQSVIDLDSRSEAVLEWCLVSTAADGGGCHAATSAWDRWSVAHGYLRIAIGIRKNLSTRGLYRANQLLTDPSRLAQLLALGFAVSPRELSSLLVDMVGNCAVSIELLRSAGNETATHQQAGGNEALQAYVEDFVQSQAATPLLPSS